ncbi:bZIP transcription factor [Salinicola tamaricis]|uniref:bZIP transcription factor n=1 Tax=Salinicola tamaricis TaxID=1771309 RepID=UPI000D09CFF0|nr:hypothetical protein [Salinicola tamaricis]
MAGSKISSTAAQVKGIIDFIEHGGGVIDAQRRLIALESEIVTLEQRYLTLEQRALALTKENDELKERVSEMEQLEVERDGYDDYRLPSGLGSWPLAGPESRSLASPACTCVAAALHDASTKYCSRSTMGAPLSVMSAAPSSRWARGIATSWISTAGTDFLGGLKTVKRTVIAKMAFINTLAIAINY